jgi:hypothetical protein
MRFYVSDTQAAAQGVVDQINVRARQVYAAQGYTIEPDGSVVGKRVSDGMSMPDSAHTETWDIPRQRLDGKWVVAHVETCPGHDFVMDQNGTTVSQYVGQDVSAPIETEDQATWWPARASYP